MQRLSIEMTSGQTSDTARRLGGDLSYISGLDSSLSRIGAYTTQTAEAALLTSAMQTNLMNIDTSSSGLSNTLMSISVSGSASQITTVGAEGRVQFDTAIATLNASIGGRALFAGVETGNAAVTDSETILSALESAIAGAASAHDVSVAVSNWFDDPAGYATTAYTGGAALAPVAVAQGETVAIDITAMHPAIRATLKGLALAALIDRGTFSGQNEQRRSLAAEAGLSLIQSQTDRSDLSAHLGMAEAQISAAQTRNSNESSSLQIARNDLVAVDPYETASKLQQTQSQLEMIYALTARVSRLSLMDYL